MPYHLFLDDMRDPVDARLTFQPSTWLIDVTHTDDDDWKIARSMEEFSHFLDTLGLPSIVSFDHDLTGDHMRHHIYNPEAEIDYEILTATGWHCAQVLMCLWENSGRPALTGYIHTANLIGAVNIADAIDPILYRGDDR